MTKFQRLFVFITLALLPLHALEKIVSVHAGGRLETRKRAYFTFFGITLPEATASPEALPYLIQLLKGRSVRLSFERPGEKPDRAGAFAAYVDFVCDTCAEAKVTSAGNTMDFSTPLIPVQELLLQQGFAQTDTAVAFSKRSYYLYLQKKAQKEGVGMWAPR